MRPEPCAAGAVTSVPVRPRARFTFDLSELRIEPMAGARARITFWAIIHLGLRYDTTTGFDFTESHVDRSVSTPANVDVCRGVRTA